MSPLFVAALPARGGRNGACRVAFKPRTHIIVIELLGPEHAGIRLPHDHACVRRKILGNARVVEFVGFLHAHAKNLLVCGSEIVCWWHERGPFVRPWKKSVSE